MSQQQAKRHAGFELPGVGGDGLAVVGGSGILMVGCILHVAEIKERAGIPWILAEVLNQQGPGTFEIFLLDLAFGGFPLGRRLRGGVRHLGVWYMSTWGQLILG